MLQPGEEPRVGVVEAVAHPYRRLERGQRLVRLRLHGQVLVRVHVPPHAVVLVPIFLLPAALAIRRRGGGEYLDQRPARAPPPASAALLQRLGRLPQQLRKHAQAAERLAGHLLWKPDGQHAGADVVACALAPVFDQLLPKRQAQEVRPEVKLELAAVDVEFAVLGAQVRHADVHVHKGSILAQLEARRDHSASL